MTGDGEGEGQFHFPDCLVLMEEGWGGGGHGGNKRLSTLDPSLPMLSLSFLWQPLGGGRGRGDDGDGQGRAQQ